MAQGISVASLERIAIGAVAITTRAIAHAPGREMTFPQWRALVILGGSDDGARIGEVAARVGVTLPATGRLLRRLERRGLVSLAVDPDDRRATRARLSDTGQAVLGEILERRRAVLREVAAEVSARGVSDLGPGLAAIAEELERRV